MTTRLYSLDDVLEDLQCLVNDFSTKVKVSELLGVSEQYVSDVLHRRRAPGDKFLRGLGYTKVIAYRYNGKHPTRE